MDFPSQVCKGAICFEPTEESPGSDKMLVACKLIFEISAVGTIFI